MPVLKNKLGNPYTNADKDSYLTTLRQGGFDALGPSHKFSTVHGIRSGQQKDLAEVVKQKIELSHNIKKSYDEHKRTHGTEDALFELGRYIAFVTGGIFAPGPLKGWDGVIRKTMDFTKDGYKGDYGQVKDEVRISLVGNNPEKYAKICETLVGFCMLPDNKMKVIKNKPRNPDDDACGYSDTNIVVKLPNGEPGEIQVHSIPVLYGKMSREWFCENLGVSKADYYKHRMNYGIEGGLGHAFYEIYDRVSKGRPNGELAAKLSKRYYKVLRSYPGIDIIERDKLIVEIKNFKEIKENRLTFSHS